MAGLSPSAAVAEAGVSRTPVVLHAPLAGWVVPLIDVPDPVFSGRILGDGVAIDPVEGALHAPCDGTVVTLHRARHALTLRAANGAEILMHIGLDTVALNGDGFTAHVAEGACVKAGDRLISFSLATLAERVKSLLSPIILTNGDGFTLALPEVGRQVSRGDDLLVVSPASMQGTAPEQDEAGPTVRREARMRDPFGIHARPAGLLSACAKRFSASVTLEANGRSANARSAVSLMLLGVRQSDPITIIARGADGEAAAAAIADLIDSAAGQQPAAGAAQPAPKSVPPAKSADIHVLPFPPGFTTEITGVQAAPGTAVGQAVRVVQEKIEVPEAGSDPATERSVLQRAIDAVRSRMETDIAALPTGHGKQAEILRAHLSFLDDDDLTQGVDTLIAQGKSAPFAWKTAIDQRVEDLRGLGNAVLAERAADLVDMQRRVLLAMLGRSDEGPKLVDNSILIADDLLPSQLTGIDSRRLAGLCLAGGGPTSHVAIIAASMGIPALVAAGRDVLRITDGTPLILDADGGTLDVNPPPTEIERISTASARRRRRNEENRAKAKDECRMADGTRIEVVANLGSPADVKAALAAGAEGCGLLRSEFLFLERDTAPTEDEQLTQYQTIATALEGRPLIIRSLDAGGDKDLPYVGLPHEENPALGLRGIRTSLWRPELLHEQLRAVLRIQPAGQCRLMLPMVATIDDVRRVRAVLAEEQKNLGIADEISLGIMIEVPAAAVMADRLAAEVDFFSVGTNDLTQYTLAMDRTNPNLAKQLDAFHPAVLRLIGQAAEGARAKGKWIGVCGHMASIPLAAPVLIGLGVTELSATAGAIPDVKAIVRTLTMDVCREVTREALAQDTAADVRRLLTRRWPEA
jgi:phosphocarrier protein FPr/phosphocarrier protein